MLIRRNQSGFALLIFMLVLISAYFLAASGLLTNTLSHQAKTKQLKNIKILNQAKVALIDYSVDYIINSGVTSHIARLPCPDVKDVSSNASDIEGIQDVSCGAAGVNSIGYFPYKTLGIGILRDSSQECLWYAVSGNYKNNQPSPNMINWDTNVTNNGFLRLVDENNKQLHGNNPEDYPIALIISPGEKVSGQIRTASSDMPNCGSNYTFTNYLEGGPIIDYPDDVDASDEKDFPKTADTIWSVLSASVSAKIKNVEYNDNVVAIYKHEIWDKIAEIETTSSNIASHLQKLTKNLALCLTQYALTENPTKNIIFAGQLMVADNTIDAQYIDKTISTPSRRYGRFPQDISNSASTDSSSLTSAAQAQFVTTYCADEFVNAGTGSGVDLDSALWKNWKDHFYVVIADDFMPGNSTASILKCVTPGSCLEIGGASNVAAIVFFAGKVSVGQNRSLIASESEIWKQYMDGVATNQNLYIGNDATNDFSIDENDYAYCIVKAGINTLVATEC